MLDEEYINELFDYGDEILDSTYVEEEQLIQNERNKKDTSISREWLDSLLKK